MYLQNLKDYNNRKRLNFPIVQRKQENNCLLISVNNDQEIDNSLRKNLHII